MFMKLVVHMFVSYQWKQYRGIADAGEVRGGRCIGCRLEEGVVGIWVASRGWSDGHGAEVSALRSVCPLCGTLLSLHDSHISS